MSSSPFHTVTIAGGTGNVGYHITEAFLNNGSFNVKIFRRKSEKDKENAKAKSLASKGAEIVYVDYSQKDDLVNALKGTDVLISTVYKSVSLYESQIPLLVAAKEASVKRFIPSEFAMGFRTAIHEVYEDKIKFREEVEKSGLEYTFINNGLFQEYFGWYAFDVKNKKATFYVDGNTKIPSTSLSDIGKYTVETLKMPEARNASFMIIGANISLNEYLQLYEKASGSKWEVVEDKDIRYRFQNKIEPIPDSFDNFKAVIFENSKFSENDNDKFSFTPKPVTEVIEFLVKQA
uniref:Isoflavone reductase A622 n=1 Tax=Anthurium amnicola TaxID=1678845 RepID=A0A1D1XLK4_9ARAE